jgi:hypothetical protein
MRVTSDLKAVLPEGLIGPTDLLLGRTARLAQNGARIKRWKGCFCSSNCSVHLEGVIQIDFMLGSSNYNGNISLAHLFFSD